MDPLFLNLPPNPRSISRPGGRAGGPGPLGFPPLSPPLLSTPPGFPPASLLTPPIPPGLRGPPLPGGLSMGMQPIPPFNPIGTGGLNPIGIPPALLLALLAGGGGGGGGVGALGLNGRRRPPAYPPFPFMLDELDDDLYEDEEEMDPVAYCVRQLRRAKRRGMQGPGFAPLGGLPMRGFGGLGVMGGFGGMEFGGL
ncbi:hypothetical protein KC360_g4089 [Hortaea werneckii]|nr:hypothetical protein KC325_g4839 [Hortaea werneckii]KAI6994160.1 hypothetical protein KC359_g4793 [Hortaea werneckii]KAI7145983.1 hypothetical protein KC344_g4066 [Hortaea werneckii]KAI7174801.1 hypothetical protein KC360_g4089 [Hortaea werneckii]